MQIIFVDLVPLAQRGKWLSLVSAVWAVGTVAGPLVGAGLAQHATWRWIFWINLPVVGAGIVLLFLFLHQERPSGNIGSKVLRFDWIGSFLLTGSSVAFLFGLTSGGVMYKWASYQTLTPLSVGAVGIVLFAAWEAKFAANPMIQRGIFSNWTLISAYVQTVFHGIVLWTIMYFLGMSSTQSSPYLPEN